MSRHRRTPAGARHSTYLRDLGDDVESGLKLVVHDLVVTNAMAQAHAEAAVRIRAEEHLEFHRDNGLSTSAQETAVWVAEAVQEDLIEGFGTRPRLVIWPRCPDHPNHPLWLRPIMGTRDEGSQAPVGDETWTCITAQRSVAELGQL